MNTNTSSNTQSSGNMGFIAEKSEFLGFVNSLSGGNVRGNKVLWQLGSRSGRKQIKRYIYEPFSFQVGMGMSKKFYDWITDSFDNGYVTKNAELVSCDRYYNIMNVYNFLNAHIAEVTIPACDGRSQEQALMTIKLNPLDILNKSRTQTPVQINVRTGRSREWLCCNFSFSLGNLPCSRVTKIDSFTWKQTISIDNTSTLSTPKILNSITEVPSVRLSISEADITQWENWYRSYVLQGEDSALSGEITFLGSNLKDVLAEIELHNAGIISLNPASSLAVSTPEQPEFVVELYIDEMKFKYNENL